MQILNPFNKKGREDTSLFDRFGIAAIGFIIVGATIFLPIIIYKWYQKANDTKRLIFWLVFVLLAILGALKDQYIYG